MSFIPIRRKALLELLDEGQLVAGYWAGYEGLECPKNASYSFEHGWRNGACDSKRREIDVAQRELVRDVVRGPRPWY
jgi:hypothetical protein